MTLKSPNDWLKFVVLLMVGLASHCAVADDIDGPLGCDSFMSSVTTIQKACAQVTDTDTSYDVEATKRIAEAARNRAGCSGRGLCYHGVKKIVRAAKIDASALRGGSAIDAMNELPRAGFKNTFPQNCSAEGAIRVYKGAASKMSKREARRYMREHYGVRLLSGDIHGHIEVVGGNGRFYHFSCNGSPESIDDKLGHWRRELVGCFVKQ